MRANAPAQTGDQIEMGDLRIDRSSRRVFVGVQELELKPMEYELLVHLASNPDRVLSREQLLRNVWGYDVPFETRTVDVHIRGLRKKLSEAGGRVPTIETTRGVGYRLALIDQPAAGAVESVT